MTVVAALIFGLVISTLIVGAILGWTPCLMFKGYQHRRQSRMRQLEQNKVLKKLEEFSYPKHLITEDDIALYLAKNCRRLFYEEDFPIYDMIKRMSKAGWNTEIPFYSKYKWGTYIFYLNIEDDIELRNKLYEIIHKYQEHYDVKKLYENKN